MTIEFYVSAVGPTPRCAESKGRAVCRLPVDLRGKDAGPLSVWYETSGDATTFEKSRAAADVFTAARE